MDGNGNGTINPADLNNNVPVTFPVAASSDTPYGDSPRLPKRSRTPEQEDSSVVDTSEFGDDSKPRKRGRPTKTKQTSSPTPSATKQTPSNAQTPQLTSDLAAQETPSLKSPAKTAAANKSAKSLPTNRDHTTDTVNKENDEYVPREFDEAGERKVTETGHLTDGREYRCRTFLVPNRGNKLFMLATECARTLNYRDSYLLFNKNKSLFKIIASQAEKEDLIHQEILPWSYRSRQIAIVTARSMYRQFGSRMIVDGRRVKDDYWEAKVRKQGFTEDDLANEKKPAEKPKPKEGPGTDIGSTGALAMETLAQGKILYKDIGPKPAPDAQGYQAAMGTSYPFHPADDMRPRDYGSVQRPRQDITGTPYEDRSQASSAAEVVSQAAQAEQFNKSLKNERLNRKGFYETFYHKDREVEAPAPQSPEHPTQSLAELVQFDPRAAPLAGEPQQLQQQQQSQQPQQLQQLQPQHSQQPQLQPQFPQQQQQQPQQTQQHQQFQQQQQQLQHQQQQQQQQQQQAAQRQQQTPRQPQHQQLQMQQTTNPQQHQQSQVQQHHQQQPQQQQQQQMRPPSSAGAPQQQAIMHQQQNPTQMMTPQFVRPPHPQNPHQSPMQNMPQAMTQQQMMQHQRAQSFGYAQGQQNQMYYPQGGIWPGQGSPIPQQHMAQYAHHPQQQSPVPQQSPHHAPQQIQQQPPQQQQQQQHSAGGMPAGIMAYQGMPGMPQGYPQMSRGMYQQSSTPQQFIQQTSGSQQPGMMGWTPPPNMGQPQQGWQGY